MILVSCWNGHYLFVLLFRPLRLPRHLPLAFQPDPVGFSQREKPLAKILFGKAKKILMKG